MYKILKELKRTTENNLKKYSIKGIDKIPNTNGYKCKQMSKRDLFMIELGRIQIINYCLIDIE